MVEMVWMAAGGFMGAAARHAVQSWMSDRFPARLPLGTLFVNVLGAFLLGWIVSSRIHEPISLLLGTGFMGAFTTFSTFKMENFNMINSGEGKTSVIYMGLSYLLGIGSAWLGFYIGI